MKIIHLTDPHLVAGDDLLYGLDPRQRLDAAVESINRLHRDADLVVVTGDLAHRGEPQAYARLARSLAGLVPPCVPILGNHDDREAFCSAFPSAFRDANGFVQGVIDTTAGRLLFLDTNQAGTHAGWFCDQRMTWLSQRLDEAPAAPVFVFMHHPPFDIGLESMDRIGLVQKERFAAVVGPHRERIRHLFYGHVHRPIFGSWMGIPASTIRGTNHQVWLDFSRIDAIPGSHEPPAYGVVLVRPDAVVVHVHDFLDDSRKFPLGEASERAMVRAPGR